MFAPTAGNYGEPLCPTVSDSSAWKPPLRQSEAGQARAGQDAIVRRSLGSIPSTEYSAFDQGTDEPPMSMLDRFRARRNLFSDASKEQQAREQQQALCSSTDTPAPLEAQHGPTQLPSLSLSRASTPLLTPATTPLTTPLKPLPPGSSPQVHTSTRPPSTRPIFSKYHVAAAATAESDNPASQPPTVFPTTVSAVDYKLPFRTLWVSEPAVDTSHAQPRASGSGSHSQLPCPSEDSEPHPSPPADSGDDASPPASQPFTPQAAVCPSAQREPLPLLKSSQGGHPLRGSLLRHGSMQPHIKSNSRLLFSHQGSAWTSRASEPGQGPKGFDASSDDVSTTGPVDTITAEPDVKAYDEDLQYVTQEELQYVMSRYPGAAKTPSKPPAPGGTSAALRPSVTQGGRTALHRQASLPHQPSAARLGRGPLQPQQRSTSIKGATPASRGASSERASDHPGTAAPAAGARSCTDTGCRSQQPQERSRERFSDTGARSQALSRANSTAANSTRGDTSSDDSEDVRNTKLHGPGSGGKAAAARGPLVRFSSMNSTTSLRSPALTASPTKLQAARFRSGTPAGLDKRAASSSSIPAVAASYDDASSVSGTWTSQDQEEPSLADYEEDLKYLTAEELQYVMKQYRPAKSQVAATSPPSRDYLSPHTSKKGLTLG